MTQKTYGYVRVSTKDQKEDRQLIALEQSPFTIDQIFIDKLSGKDFNRPQYRSLIRKAKKGDLIVIKSIDRLGRNYEEIMEQWRIITKEKQINMVVLDMPLLDTRQTGKNLTGTFIADLVLQILSYVAQTERENIRQRQAEGIAAARMKGIHFGRKSLPLPDNFPEVARLWKNGELSARQAAKQLDVSHPTFLNWVSALSPDVDQISRFLV